jgi:hypothetical protein
LPLTVPETRWLSADRAYGSGTSLLERLEGAAGEASQSAQ